MFISLLYCSLFERNCLYIANRNYFYEQITKCTQLFYAKLFINSNCPVYEIKMSHPNFDLEKLVLEQAFVFIVHQMGPVPERRNNSIPGINLPYFRDNFIPGINSVPERRNSAIQ